MTPDVERQVINAVIQYKERKTWKAWGMHTLRKQGAAILLQGVPGTGKTSIAEYLSLAIRKKGMKEISFADFGSHIPGENSRQIRLIFEYAKEHDYMTIFMDDCEAILWDRSRAGSTAMWMLEVIDELLMQIGKYQGLVILASNKPELLDSGIERRLIANIVVPVPEYRERLILWRTKMPHAFPLKLTMQQTEDLAQLVVTGAEIEIAIINCASDAIRLKKKMPSYEKLLEETRALAVKRDFASKIATTTPTVD